MSQRPEIDDPSAGSLTRRSLLRGGAAVGALAAVGPLLSQPPMAGQAAGASPASFELLEVPIAELQAGLESGRWSSRALVESYLSRIEALDGKVRSVLEVNPEALVIAETLDAERREKGARGPLHGIPILLKDNIATADRMTTTAGSIALAGSIPARDAFVVARLRAAGAVLLGKTNLSEWANFRSTHSSSGWSSRGGQCRNPYALDRSPSGSSSGSAVAVAASFAAAAVGTETDGSIVSPSAACALVGIKPTLGLVSRAGIIPIAHSQDTAGPMARTVADAAILLAALAGADERDPATRASHGRAPMDLAKLLDPEGLKGARIGVAREKFFGYSPATDRVIEEALEAMRRLGAVIVDPADITTAGEIGDPEFEVLLYEFKADLNRYLADLGPDAPIHSLREVIEHNERHRERTMPFFGQEILVMAEAKGPLSSKEYRAALAKSQRLARRQGIDATLAKHKLDAIVAPTGGPAWLIDPVNGDSYPGGSSTPAAVAGYPSITVPAGSVCGLPIGLSFLGPAWSEAKLIRMAFAFEQATKARTSPLFLPTATLEA